MAYTKKEVQQIIKIKSLYQMACVNWTGKTKEDDKDPGGEYYSEIIAANVLNDDELLNIPIGDRRDDFKFEGHDGKTKNETSSRMEERFCLDRYNHRDTEKTPFGKVINYQVNIIKGTKINVDLVAYDDKEDTLWLIEVKGHKGESPETLLRCALEIETYYRCLEDCKDKLLTTLKSADKKEDGISLKTKIKKAVWVPVNSQAAKDYNDAISTPCLRPNLAHLIDKWKIRVETYIIK